MAEFGENLKRVREEKGITQQTLADYLYVTRQAVSRWEGGSRYPDLMTAKKMAQFLEVSLDDLLSDDDMKLYVEKSAIMDSPVGKKVQIALIVLTLMCAMMHITFYLVRYTFADVISANEALKVFSETTNSTGNLFSIILFALMWGIMIFAAVNDKLNAKLALFMSVVFFGTGVVAEVVNLVNIYALLGMWDGYFWKQLLLLICNLIFVFVYIRFFSSKKIVSPWPIYIVNGVVFAESAINIVTSAMQEVPVEYMDFNRGITMLNLLGLLSYALELGLFALMAYTLDKKRKLAAR